LTDNHERTKEWLKLAFNNIERTLRNYKEKDYPFSVFLIQMSIEQLLKALIFLLGLQFKKTHEPSKILDSVKWSQINQIDEKIVRQIKKIASLAKEIESEGTSTRYGEIIDGKLILPEDKYSKTEANKYLKDLSEILKIFNKLLTSILYFELESKKIIEFIEKINNLIKI